MKDWPGVIQDATEEMFSDANWPEKFSKESLAFGPDFDATGEELTNAGEEFHQQNAAPVRFDLGKLTTLLLRERHCVKSNHIVRNGTQVRGWKGVKVAVESFQYETASLNSSRQQHAGRISAARVGQSSVRYTLTNEVPLLSSGNRNRHC